VNKPTGGRPGSDPEPEGWESLEESGGALTPNEDLERALREATEAVEAREAQARARGGAAGPGGHANALAAKIGDLEQELEQAKTHLAEAQDRYLRLQADFDNFRRRTLKEREEAVQYGHQNLVKDLLYTVDNLERALEHAHKSGREDLDALLQGIDLVHRELVGVLSKHGVTEIEAQGLPFDPGVHEALAQVDDGTVAPNTVVQVFQKGYRLRDRLLRPAQVVVSRAAARDAQSEVGG
jgi:molecular chaperone GrpE